MSEQPTNEYIETEITEAHRTWGIFQHLIGLLSFFEPGILGLIGAIVMWRLRNDESDWLDDHGREAVNFQISMFIYSIIGAILIACSGMLLFPIVVPALIAIRFFGSIKGALNAKRGAYVRLPMNIRFIKPKI